MNARFFLFLPLPNLTTKIKNESNRINKVFRKRPRSRSKILPPLKGTGIEKVYETIDLLREFDPKYINITTHRSEYVYTELGNGLFERKRIRRRPGTVAVAAAIQKQIRHTGSSTRIMQRIYP